MLMLSKHTVAGVWEVVCVWGGGTLLCSHIIRVFVVFEMINSPTPRSLGSTYSSENVCPKPGTRMSTPGGDEEVCVVLL